MNAYEKFMQKTDLKREKNISNMLFLFFSVEEKEVLS